MDIETPTLDYELWAAAEGLTPYELACLLLGTTPVARDGYSAPIPNDVSSVARNDWELRFYRVLSPLRFALEAGEFPECAIPGAIAPKEALAWLAFIFEQRGWDDDIRNHPFSKLVSLGQPTYVQKLLNRIRELESEVDFLGAAEGYIPPMMNIVYEIIHEFYLTPNQTFPKKDVVISWLRDRYPELSDNQRAALYTVTQHPSRREGRPGRRQHVPED
jgi:hypothetical protein